MKLRKYISSIDHESVQKNLFENCGWCKLHRPADCPKRTVPSPVERSPALHIFLGTRNEAISRRLTCTGMRLIPGLPPFLISQGASVLPSFSNPGAYIPFTRSYPFVNFKLSTIIILIPEIHEEQHGSTSLQHDLDTYSGGWQRRWLEDAEEIWNGPI